MLYKKNALNIYSSLYFNAFVFQCRTSEKAFGQNTGWLFLGAADSLFVVSIFLVKKHFNFFFNLQPRSHDDSYSEVDHGY